MRKNFFCFLAVLLVSILSFPSSVLAVGSGGFENASFSAKSLSQSNAVVAQADEPAAISYNPAGIVDLPGFQAQSNIMGISAFTHYSSSVQRDTTSSGTVVPVPTAYMTVNPGDAFDNRVVFGVGSDSPFGLSNKYDASHGSVHYAGWRNWLKMYTVKPTVAIKLTDWLSVGGGPMYYRIFDWGGIQAYPNVLVAGGLTTDGQVRLNLSGNRWGWQMGALLKPHKQHQFGFYFRSPVAVRTRGLIKVENSTSGNFETGGNAKMDLPLNFTFAYAFKPTDRTTIETDFGYTRWAAHKRLFINNDPVNGREDAIIAAIGKNAKDYSDSLAVHLGGNHKITEKLTVMGGTLFYWAAVPKDHFIPAVADANSLGVSVGADYKFNKYVSIGLAYFNRFYLRRRIDNGIGESLGVTGDGKYFSYLQEFAISFLYHWDQFPDIFKKKEPAVSSEQQPV